MLYPFVSIGTAFDYPMGNIYYYFEVGPYDSDKSNQLEQRNLA